MELHQQTQSFVIVVEKPVALLSGGSGRQVAALNIKNLLREDAEPSVLKRWGYIFTRITKKDEGFRKILERNLPYKERDRRVEEKIFTGKKISKKKEISKKKMKMKQDDI